MAIQGGHSAGPSLVHFEEDPTARGAWVKEGRISYREEMIEGLEQAPSAFVGLLRGEAFGKRVVQLNG